MQEENTEHSWEFFNKNRDGELNCSKIGWVKVEAGRNAISGFNECYRKELEDKVKELKWK